MNNKIINDISSEVYIKISERLKAKKKKLKLTREQIFESDIPLVSRALNNRRIKNKNPYLLTPTLADAVVKIMKFKSTYELVWGEKEERQKLLEHFFINGLKYLMKIHEDTIDKTLITYFDYAYSKAMYDYIVPNATTDVHEIIHRYEFHRDNAIYDFIKQNLKELSEIHRRFFENKVTIKLIKNIQLFYNTVFLDYIISKQSQQGLNFYNLVIQILVFEEKPLMEFFSKMQKNPYFMDENMNKLSFEQQIQALGGVEKPNDEESSINKVVSIGKEFINSILHNQQYLM